MISNAQDFFKRLKDHLFGKPLSVANEQRKKWTLAALIAWIALGADGLSSACYGPEQAFIALGANTHLSLYLALATALTVFIIALSYNQVIELFPNGGGGYQVATEFLGPYPGLVSGSALIIDYMLTIAISIAAAVEAVSSLLPIYSQDTKILIEIFLILGLMALALRRIKKSWWVLLPIIVGFCVLHFGLIGYGIVAHHDILPTLIPATAKETGSLIQEIGWIAVAAFFLKAYSLGAGTYTGIEAVSNNVQYLAEPRVKTGKLTMFFMALSLSLLAAGIIILYLLWGAVPEEGQTLNAVVFRSVIENIGFTQGFETTLLLAVLVFEGLLLFTAANTGIIGGKSVLTSMSADSWLPHQLSYLSSRLVSKNNIILLCLGAIGILWWTEGAVEMLVILYAINVFLTFSLSLLGLCRYWIKHRDREKKRWKRQLLLSTIGLVVATSILGITIVSKFTSGGWFTLLLTLLLISLCLYIKSHYDKIARQVEKADERYANLPYGSASSAPKLDPLKPTAAIIVSLNKSGGLYPLEWITERFTGYFHNIVFVSAGAVDSASYRGSESIELLRQEANVSLKYFENYCHSHGIASTSYFGFGTDKLTEITKLCETVQQDFPNVIFFASMLAFENENWITRLLHNKIPFLIQQALHQKGQQMIVLPMKVS